MKRQSGTFRLPLLTWAMLALFGGMVVFAGMQLASNAQAIEGDKVAAALQRGKPTIAEFGSDTCHTCQEMAQVLQQLEQDYGEQLSVAHVNIVKEPEYTKTYRIMLMPTQVFFDAEGKETGRHMGALTEQEILQALGISGGKS